MSTRRALRSLLALCAASMFCICLTGAVAWAEEGVSASGTVMQNTFPSVEVPSFADEASSDDDLLQATSLPSSFDLRNVNGVNYVTPVRNQGQYGMCWAFAFCASAESNYLMKTKGETTILLSPSQIAYYAYNQPQTMRSGLAGDSSTLASGWDKGFSTGGNSTYAMLSSMCWTGLVDENAQPAMAFGNLQGTSFEANAATYTDAYAYGSNTYTVSNVVLVNANDRDAIKQLLMEKGACEASYYHMQTSEGYDDSTYYNSSTAAYYQNKQTGTNHAVTIVGWDDNYAVKNFSSKCRPSQKGAWLVKNSWGETWGKSGYFWISYEDEAISSSSNSMAFVEVEPASATDDIYQHDGTLYTGSTAYGYSLGDSYLMPVANVFEVAGDAEQSITEIALDVTSLNTNYSIQIYTGVTGDPSSGKAAWVSPQTGSLTYSGYQTIKLDNPVTVKPGEKYAVAVTLSKSGAWPYLGYDKSDTSGSVVCSSTVGAGQSYFALIYDDGSIASWTDYGSTNKANWRIKAYTEPTSESTERIVKVTSYDLGSSQYGQVGNLAGGGTYQIGARVDISASEVEGYEFVGWYEWDASNDYSGEPLADSYEACIEELTMDSPVNLVAVYRPIATATFTVTGPSVSVVVEGETVGTTSAQGSSLEFEYPLGTEITLKYGGSETFLAWQDENNRKLGAGAQLTFTLVRNCTVCAKATAGSGSGGEAYVEFDSYYGQVLKAETWEKEGTGYSFPTPPSRIDYSFTGWAIQSGKNLIAVSSVADIQSHINGTPLTLVPQYTKNSTETAIEYPDEGTDMKFLQSYSLTIGDTHKLSFRVTRNVPSAYQVCEQGILYTTDSSYFTEGISDFVIGASGVRKAVSSDTANKGLYVMNLNVTGRESTVVYVRGYMVLYNPATGVQETYYSDNAIGASFK